MYLRKSGQEKLVDALPTLKIFMTQGSQNIFHLGQQEAAPVDNAGLMIAGA